MHTRVQLLIADNYSSLCLLVSFWGVMYGVFKLLNELCFVFDDFGVKT